MYFPIKRTLDCIISFISIVILLPFMIPIMVGLKITGEGYVFYRQKRIGYKNRHFKIWKFATMLKNSPNMAGGIITGKNDPRITPMGGFLRMTKINELPQLINVLFGEMSLIGPRPVMSQSFGSYPPKVKKVIYQIKPGITGIGSIVFRDEEQLINKVNVHNNNAWHFYTSIIYPYKGKLEAWYQQNISFLTDLKIIFLTAWHIFFPKSNLVFRVFKDLPPRPKELDPDFCNISPEVAPIQHDLQKVGITE